MGNSYYFVYNKNGSLSDNQEKVPFLCAVHEMGIYLFYYSD